MTTPSTTLVTSSLRRLWHATLQTPQTSLTTPPPPFAFTSSIPTASSLLSRSISTSPATTSQHRRPISTFFTSPRLLKKSPRYVLSRGFASGLFAWSLPSKAKASETAAVVSSCSNSTAVDRIGIGNVKGSARTRKLRAERLARAADKRHDPSLVLYPLARAIWRRGVCSDCRGKGATATNVGFGGVKVPQQTSRRASSSSKSGKKEKEKKEWKGEKDKEPGKDNGKESKESVKESAKAAKLAKESKKDAEKAAAKETKAKEAEAKAMEAKRLEWLNPELKETDGRPRTLAAAAAAIAKRAARDHGFMERLPQIHRPSKEELLAAASNAWDRLRIRFKWLTIRQIRPFNIDEISAFFSWIVLGNLAWILLGTTTFFSMTIWLVNTVFAQEYLAKVVGNYLTQEMGMKVVFESAIVPRWKDGCISFKNVFLSRRPGKTGSRSVEKGSSSVAAAAAAAAAFSEEHSGGGSDAAQEDDGNYTQFDLTVDTVNVTISLAKWMNGRGLLVDVDMKGVRGVVDRTHISWDPTIDPRSYKHEYHPGDFELDHFKLEDLLVTVYQPGDFRPFHVSIFTCDLPQLRKRWLFYDFLSANHISGSYDDSLFTIHPRQSHGPISQNSSNSFDSDTDMYPWKKTSRFRIDGLNVDHMNRGYQGPLNWIVSGNLDIIADIHFPEDTADGISKFMHDMMDRMENSIAARREKVSSMMKDSAVGDLTYGSMVGVIGAAVGLKEDESAVTNALAIDADGSYTTGLLHEDSLQTFEDSTSGSSNSLASTTNPTPASTTSPSADQKFMMIDLHLEMNDTRAAIPLFTQDLSYKNNALMRPIIAYINSQRTIIPINCRLVKRASEFDGSWTLFDSGFMDDLSAEVYDAFVRDIADADIKKRRIRAVGLWSLQVFMNAFLAAMAGTMIA